MNFGQKEMVALILLVALIVFGVVILFLPSDDLLVPTLAGLYKGIIILYYGKRTAEEVIKKHKEEPNNPSTNRPFVDKNFLMRGIIAIISLIFLLPAFFMGSANLGVFVENAVVVVEAVMISYGLQQSL